MDIKAFSKTLATGKVVPRDRPSLIYFRFDDVQPKPCSLHHTKVFGAIIALSLAGKTGGRRKLRFIPL